MSAVTRPRQRVSNAEAGRQSQARLEQYLHALYDRQTQAEQAPRLADEQPLAAFDYLVFSVDGENFAVPLLCVTTVAAPPALTPLPFLPAHFLGAFNLRGRIVSVVDLRRYLGKTPRERGRDAAVIVVQGKAHCIGLLVDTVSRVATVARPEEIHPIRLLDPDEILEQVLK